MQWIFASVIDLVESGQHEPAVLTNSMLNGSKGSKGLVDLLLFKLSMRDHLFNVFLSSSRAFPDAVKTVIRSKVATPAGYRLEVSPNKGAVVDLSWKKGWAQSSELLLQFVEKVLYGREYDGSLKSAVKFRKDAARATSGR